MAALTFVSQNEDQTDTNSYSIASQPSGTAGARRFAAIWGRKNSAGSGLPATCSIGGQALSPVAGSMIDGNITGDNTSMSARWFTGVVSVGGNQTVAFTFTSDGGGGAAATMIRAGFALYEGDGFSATPHDALVDEATASNDRTLTGTIDTADGGAVAGIGAISSSTSIGCTLTGLATEDFDIQESSANNNICAGHENGLSSETDRTITFAWAAGGSTDDACISVISLAPVEHALTATGIATGAPSVGAPALAQTHAFVATEVAAGAPVTGAPTLAVVHALAAVGVSAGAASVGAPPLAQTHALAATEVAAGGPVTGAPTLAGGAAPIFIDGDDWDLARVKSRRRRYEERLGDDLEHAQRALHDAQPFAFGQPEWLPIPRVHFGQPLDRQIGPLVAPGRALGWPSHARGPAVGDDVEQDDEDVVLLTA
jgi:hypothetical protein